MIDLQPGTTERVRPASDVAPVTTLGVSPSIAPSGNDGSIGALILGGAHGSLAVARSLGRRGIPVCFVASEPLITRFSRYVRANWSWRGVSDPQALEWLLDLAHRHCLKGWVLFPGGDSEAEFISQNHAPLSALFRVTTLPWEAGRWAFDKRLTYERAASLGIDFPRSYSVLDRRELAGLDCQFPLVLKPATRDLKNDFTRDKAWRVDDRQSLIERYDEAARLVGKNAVVLQEMIPGSGAAQFSYAGVADRGTPVAALTACRTRQFPVEFGYTSTLVQTVDNPAVEESARAFLRSLDYSGMFEVEFKFDARDGRYKILDVNARTWTWCALGPPAGADFAYVMWCLAIGEEVTPVRGRSGISWMHASRDIVSACTEMWLGRISPGEYLKSLRGPMVFAAFAKDDPLPGVLDLPLVAFRQGVRRIRSFWRDN
ncbi:MAG: ATP-grasp domain-containing protein [Pseudolabrys sp.]